MISNIIYYSILYDSSNKQVVGRTSVCPVSTSTPTFLFRSYMRIALSSDPLIIRPSVVTARQRAYYITYNYVHTYILVYSSR